MRRLVLALFGVPLLAAGVPDARGVLTVDVGNVRIAKGVVHIDVCPEAKFLKDDCPWSGNARAKLGETRVTVANLPAGRYAVQAFLDENSNGEAAAGLFFGFVAGGAAGTTNGQTTNYGATAGAIGAMVTTMTASAPAQVPLNCVTLPVSFLGITAVKNSDAVDLNWQVSYEINTLKYVVERSTDGINFSDIGSTPFRDGNSLNNAYQYSDKNLPAVSGKIYYRIREVDVDGSVAYSKTVSVQQTTLAGKLSVYPNPARTSVTVSFNHTVGGAISLRLFDLKGSLLWQQQQSAAAGQNNVQIDYIRNLPAGVYILQWFDGLTPEQTKILVDR